MPALSQHRASEISKVLVVGHSGGGKTGALASLAIAGYNLRIIDSDGNLGILFNLLKDNPEALARVEYETLTDARRNVNGVLVPRQAKSWQRAMALIENWKTETAEFGSITTWGSKDILVIDTLSSLSRTAMNFVLAMNNRLGTKPYNSDYGDAQSYIRSFLETIADESVRCNVIINTHITFIGQEEVIIKNERKDVIAGHIIAPNANFQGFPNAIGKALPPEIGRYFGTMLQVKKVGMKNMVLTKTTDPIELKNSNPLKVKPSYPIETGLADYFKDIQSQSGTA